MRAEPIVLALFAVGFAAGVAAKDAPGPPSMEMLEFLGSYETAGCRYIDPLQLEDALKEREGAKRVVPVKNGSKKARPQKGKNDE